MGQRIVEARVRVRAWACVGLVAVTAHCGKDSKHPGSSAEAGSGGEGAAADAGAAGEPGAGTSGQNQGGAPMMDAAGAAGADAAGAAGAAGAPVELDCEPEEIKLRLVTYEGGPGDGQQVTFDYDEAGRLLKATFSDDNQYTYFYDDQERIERVSSAYNEETHSFSIAYGSESERYRDDDMSTSVMVELAGARWLKTEVSDVSGTISSTSVPTWEDGLVTQVATTAGQQETLARLRRLHAAIAVRSRNRRILAFVTRTREKAWVSQSPWRA